MTYRWNVFEADILDDLGLGATFTSKELAAWYGLTSVFASACIQNYLDAQRREHGKYVLHREGRTSASVWTIGQRSDDARNVIGQFGDDVLARIQYAVAPDLHRIAQLNPRAVPVIQNALEPAVQGLVSIIGAMLQTVNWTP